VRVYTYTASSARTLHCITVVHYDIDGVLLLTSDELSLRDSLVQLDITPWGSFVVYHSGHIISATDLTSH